MKVGLFGLNMRPCVTPEAIAAAARAAEEAGFESFWGGEHIVQADPQTSDSPMPPRTEFIDLTVAIAFAAGPYEAPAFRDRHHHFASAQPDRAGEAACVGGPGERRTAHLRIRNWESSV